MKVLLASAEVSPFAKAGGLGDVAGSLPKFIKKHGHDIRVIMPFYGHIDRVKYGINNYPEASTNIVLGGQSFHIELYSATLPNTDVPVYFVKNDEFFTWHKEIYPRLGFLFEHERFILFGASVLKFAKLLRFQPDIIHCNDWHTANIPVYLKSTMKDDPFFDNTATVFSIHNLAYQGIYHSDILHFANIPKEQMFNTGTLEYHGNVNWMKGAIELSDKVSTVSTTYAQEIQTPEYGEGLDGVLRGQSYKLSGILNGIDYELFNPMTDTLIAKQYSSNDLSGKAECKKAVQEIFHLKKDNKLPVIGLVSRLVNQKGLDLIAHIAHDLKNEPLQLVVLGSGDRWYEDIFRTLNWESDNIKALIGFDANLAQKIYAGADMFLMPSKFEPCGIGQMIALSYGTIPIVRKTGGLNDTITDISIHSEKGNGFVFENYNAEDLLATIKRAVICYKENKQWHQLIQNAMVPKFGWEQSAEEYIRLYEDALKKH